MACSERKAEQRRDDTSTSGLMFLRHVMNQRTKVQHDSLNRQLLSGEKQCKSKQHNVTRKYELEELAVTMYCNLRPPDITPVVVLSFNYYAHPVPACTFHGTFNNSAAAAGPIRQIFAQSRGQSAALGQSYCHLYMSNLGAIRHLGFDRKWIFKLRGLQDS